MINADSLRYTYKKKVGNDCAARHLPGNCGWQPPQLSLGRLLQHLQGPANSSKGWFHSFLLQGSGYGSYGKTAAF